MPSLVLLALLAVSAQPGDRADARGTRLRIGNSADELALVTPGGTYRRRPEPNTRIWDFALIPGSTKAVVTVQSGRAYLLDLKSRKPPTRILPAGRGFHTVAVSADSRVALGDWTGNVYVIPVSQLRAGNAHWPRRAAGDESKYGGVYIWSATAKRWDLIGRHHLGYVTGAAFSKDGRTLFSGDQNGNLLATDLKAAGVQFRHRLKSSVTGIVFEGNRAVIHSADGQLHQWEPKTGLRQIDRKMPR